MTALQRRRLGRTDITVSNLCLGTMMYGDQIDEQAAHRQMDRCFERGIDFLDTAEMYTIPPKPETQGDSERIVGNWIKERGVRDRIVLATKVVGRSTMSHFRGGETPRVTPAQIRLAVEGSLARLQTDYIDLYQIHWPDRQVPIFGADSRGYQPKDNSDAVPVDEQLSALGRLVDEGKIRTVGLSNETPWGVMAFLRASEALGLPRVVSIQNAYNLINRTFEYGLAEMAMMEDVGLLAYSPMAQGALSGKYLNGARPAGSRWQLFGRFSRYIAPHTDEAIAAYLALAKKADLDPSAMAMQFVTTRPWVTSNIFGATTDAQLDQVFASLDIQWTDELQRQVDDIHVQYPNPCP